MRRALRLARKALLVHRLARRVARRVAARRAL